MESLIIALETPNDDERLEGGRKPWNLPEASGRALGTGGCRWRRWCARPASTSPSTRRAPLTTPGGKRVALQHLDHHYYTAMPSQYLKIYWVSWQIFAFVNSVNIVTLLRCNIEIETKRPKTERQKDNRQKMMNRTQKTSRRPPMIYDLKRSVVLRCDHWCYIHP